MTFLIRDVKDVPGIASACGPLHVLSTAEDSPVGNASVLKAKKHGKPHFHREATELYYVLSGYGAIRIDGSDVAVHRGSFLIIKPQSVHQVRPLHRSTLVLLVVSIPAWQENDEIIVEDPPASA